MQIVGHLPLSFNWLILSDLITSLPLLLFIVIFFTIDFRVFIIISSISIILE